MARHARRSGPARGFESLPVGRAVLDSNLHRRPRPEPLRGGSASPDDIRLPHPPGSCRKGESETLAPILPGARKRLTATTTDNKIIKCGRNTSRILTWDNAHESVIKGRISQASAVT